MKKLVSALVAILGMGTLAAQDVVVKGPDGKLQLAVFAQNETKPCYSVSYNGQTMLEKSPLGMDTNIGDFTKNLKLAGHSVDKIDTVYRQTRIKVSEVHYRANELTCHFIHYPSALFRYCLVKLFYCFCLVIFLSCNNNHSKTHNNKKPYTSHGTYTLSYEYKYSGSNKNK